MTDQEKNSAETKEGVFREIPLRYYGVEDTIGIFADQAVVSHSTGLFTLLFFQMHIPPTEKSEDRLSLEAIPARCVARIILTPALMEQFLNAMEKNMAKYRLLVEQHLINSGE